MSSTPIQGPPFASPCIDVPPSLRDSSSSSAVSEIASSHLQTPTSLTPLSLSGRIATVPPPFPLGMNDQSATTPHSVGERQAPLPLELPGLDPLPVQNLPAAAAGPHTFDAGMDLGDGQAATPHGLPASNSPAAASTSELRLKDHTAWEAVDKEKYKEQELEEIGNLTLGSHRDIFWKCRAPECTSEWSEKIRGRCKTKSSIICSSCARSSKPRLKNHEAWAAVNKQAYTPQELAKIGNFTLNSDKAVSWKCQKVGCENVWVSSIRSRCKAMLSTVCKGCTELSKPRLQEHEAWEAVDTSEYTKEELEEIGNLTQGSSQFVKWRCTTPNCSIRWVSTVITRVKAINPLICSNCAQKKRGTKRVQKKPEDTGSRTVTKRSRTTKE